MPSSRPKLTLDEQSFQDMLAAAYTIQEHNTKRKRALQPVPACGKCGSAVEEGESLCPLCAADEVRPGEKLQQKWASLWLMGQEQGLFPEPPPPNPGETKKKSATLDIHATENVAALAEEVPAIRIHEAEEAWPELSPDRQEEAFELVPSETTEDAPDETGIAFQEAPEAQAPSHFGFRDLQLRLRFHRADLYLVAAILVSTFAMLWVLLATPTAGSQNKPRLRPWERALISMGLAEAPDPPARRGNPNSRVWVDPKTALYYCVGEEQFGKTDSGYSTTQRDAQLNAFEPASRAACD